MPADAVHHFAAMGTTAHVVVVGGDEELTHLAQRQIERLEARWSRFRPTSEVSSLNRFAGWSMPVSPETQLLVQRSIDGARATEGRFDPTIGGALLAHGYDRPFGEVPAHAASLVPAPAVDGAWPLLEVDPVAGTATVPAGTTFDPGGIGKGLACDLVATWLAERADGALVNLGGDARAVGRPPTDDGWVFRVDDPHSPDQDRPDELLRFAIPSGAVATSSSRRRRWVTAEGEAHHLIDPWTGRPAASDLSSATAVASEAWWAEVHATSTFLRGSEAFDDDAPAAEGEGFDALGVTTHGRVVATAGLACLIRTAHPHTKEVLA